MMNKDNKNYLQATVDRLEEDHAVLIFNDGQKIIWPLDQLPDELTEGEVISLSINGQAKATIEKEEIAKTLLNQILKREDNV